MQSSRAKGTRLFGRIRVFHVEHRRNPGKKLEKPLDAHAPGAQPPRSTSSEMKKPTFRTPERAALAAAMRASDISFRTIAETFGCCVATVRHLLNPEEYRRDMARFYAWRAQPRRPARHAKPPVFTPENGARAKSLREAGGSINAIARALGTSARSVEFLLDPAKYARAKTAARRWNKANPDRFRANKKRHLRARGRRARSSRRRARTAEAGCLSAEPAVVSPSEGA